MFDNYVCWVFFLFFTYKSLFTTISLNNVITCISEHPLFLRRLVLFRIMTFWHWTLYQVNRFCKTLKMFGILMFIFVNKFLYLK